MADKLFNAQVNLNGTMPAAPPTHLRYTGLSGADLRELEKAILGMLVNLNNSPTPMDTLPQLSQVIFTAEATEAVDSKGQHHILPKPFFGPVSIPWYNLPQTAAKTLSSLLALTLAPFAKFAVKSAAFLLAVALVLLTTGTISAQCRGGVCYQPPVMIQPVVPVQPIQPGTSSSGGTTVWVAAPGTSGVAVVAPGVSVTIQGHQPRRGFFVRIRGR